jgi:taurine dioxygenase
MRVLKIERMTAAIGGVVSGVDLRKPLPDELFERIRAALVDRQVLFFHDQDLTDEQHRAFALRFGPLGRDGVARLTDDPRDIFYIEDTPERPPGGADRWHTDVSWVEDPPALGMLNARIIPEYGGDTLWASLFAAYDALSPRMQAFCQDLRIVNYPARGFLKAAERAVGPGSEARVRDAFPPVEHPLVRTHPVSGRPALFLTGTMQQVVGLHPDESDALIRYLRSLLDDPNLQVRWRWRAFDVALWDQTSTNHRALGDHRPQHRKMRHCAVAGGRPFYRRAA